MTTCARPLVFACAWLALAAFARAQDAGSYGSVTASESALTGMLYDLKQSPDRKLADPGNVAYWNILDDFISSHWDENILNHYFRASRPLYTTQVFIPRINAAEGPKAFGVEKIVEPNRYVVHYKGQVSPPEDGTYRFVGFGDNVLAVAINEKNVLYTDWVAIPMPKVNWKPPAPPQTTPCYEGHGFLANGQWFTMKTTDTADLDILIGESDGGASGFFLMIEKQGTSYPKTPKGDPILPIFQVAPYATPHLPPDQIGVNGPDFSPGKPWTCFQ